MGAGSLFHIRREMTGSGTTLATSRLVLSVDMVVDHRHAPPQPEGDGLYVETLLDFSATALSQAAQQALKRRLTLDATTFDQDWKARRSKPTRILACIIFF